jgi:hypothetical protein
MADRLTTWSILGTNAPHEAQRNSRAGGRPHSPTCTYTSSSRIPKPLLPSFQRAPRAAVQQPVAPRQTTQVEAISEYMREYEALGPEFHHDMTLVEYCGLGLRNRLRYPQRGGQQ